MTTRVAIIGFGLIGASLALALKESDFSCTITALDRAERLDDVTSCLSVDQTVDVGQKGLAEAALSQSDVAVLAAPVSQIVKMLPWALAHCPVVTDCGSTKVQVLEQALNNPRRGRFVAGHPMAGDVRGGLSRARADLFAGRTWFLCRDGAEPDALELVERMVSATSARVTWVTAGAHDAATARASHLPQLLASALSVVCREAGSTDAGGPALERMTRGAGGPESIWADIFSSNPEAIAAALEECMALLGEVRDELRQSPAEVSAALKLLADARDV